MRACRPIAFPNIGFLVQLKAYESVVFGKCSDVPLKLEKLFGLTSGSLKQEEGEGDAEDLKLAKGKSAEDQSEEKAIKDG